MLDRKICYVAIVPTSTAPVSRATPVITNTDSLSPDPISTQIPSARAQSQEVRVVISQAFSPQDPKVFRFQYIFSALASNFALDFPRAQHAPPSRTQIFLRRRFACSAKQLLREYLEKEGVREVTKDQNNQVRNGATSRAGRYDILAYLSKNESWRYMPHK